MPKSKKRNSSIKKKSVKLILKKGSTKSLKKRTPYLYMSFMDGKENRLLEKRHNCEQKHCSKELDEQADYSAIYTKAHAIACPPGMKDDEFVKCDNTFYVNSDYEKYMDNTVGCRKKHCNKYSKSLKKHRDKIIFKELNIPPAIGKLIVSKKI